MKKIMKRLLTGVLTLATVFTALPVTQVHAADSVYTTTDGKAGTIVKIDNGGSEVSSFEESIMNADGQIAYCIDINTNFQSGYKNRMPRQTVKHQKQTKTVQKKTTNPSTMKKTTSRKGGKK